MSFGGGSTTQEVVQKSEPWGPQQPYLRKGFREAQQLLDNSGGPAELSPWSRDALAMLAARAADQGGLFAQARAAAGRTLSGSDLTAGHPALSAATAAANAPLLERWRSEVAPGIDAGFSAGGRFGSGLYAAARNGAEATLARGLLDQAAGLGWQAYADERDRMERAMMMAPQIETADARAMLEAGQTLDAHAEAQRLWPWEALGRYMAAIGGNWGGTSTQTQTRSSSGNPFGGLLSGLEIGAGLGLGPLGIVGGGLLGLLAG